MIEKRELFINPYGWSSYLKEKDGMYFLSNDLFTNLPSDLYDSKYGPVYPQQSPQQAIEQIEIDHIERIVEHLKKNSVSILDTLQPFLRQAIFKAFIQSEKTLSSPLNRPVIEYGIKHNEITPQLQMIQPFEEYNVELQKWVSERPVERSISEDMTEQLAIQLATDTSIRVYGIKDGDKFKVVYFKTLPIPENETPLQRDAREKLNQKERITTLLSQKNKGNVCNSFSQLNSLYETVIGTEPASVAQKCEQLKQYVSSRYFNPPVQEFSLILDEKIHELVKKWFANKKRVKEVLAERGIEI